MLIFVAERGIRGEKPIVFDDCGFELMTTLCVSGVDLRPRWREEHPPMILMQLPIRHFAYLSSRLRSADSEVCKIEQPPIIDLLMLRATLRNVASPVVDFGNLDPWPSAAWKVLS